jgi:hypothetical protein
MNKKKMKGGHYYKFDVFTLGMLAVEREYNNSKNITRDDLYLLRNLNAFAHSLDFVSDNYNIWNTPNIFNFVIKNQTKVFKNYFWKNIDIICNEEFVNLLIELNTNDSISKLINNKCTDKEKAYEDLINSIKKLTDFILFNDMDGSNDIVEIKKNELKPTKEFLSELTKLYSENYVKAMNNKKQREDVEVTAESVIGGSGKLGELPIEDAIDLYPNTDSRAVYDYYYKVVEFQNYSDIIKNGHFNINEKYFNYLAIIIGFSSLFRYSGIFKKKTINYESIHNMYHLLRNYPNFDTIENQNKYIDDYFRKAAIILIEIVKLLYHHCVGKKITKRVCSISALNDLRATNIKKQEKSKSDKSDRADEVQERVQPRLQAKKKAQEAPSVVDQFSFLSFPSLPK